MSKDFRHGLKQMAKAGRARQAYREPVPRDVKPVSEQRIKNVLRHAVKLQDIDTFEDYDEKDIS